MNMISALIVGILLALGKVVAMDAPKIEYGPATNGVQMAICLDRVIQTNSTGYEVPLLIFITNSTVNKSFVLYGYNWYENGCKFHFEVVYPSGKKFSLPMLFYSGSGSFHTIEPGKCLQVKVRINKITPFDEMGTYEIIASNFVEPEIVSDKGCKVVSNTLKVRIATNAPPEEVR